MSYILWAPLHDEYFWYFKYILMLILLYFYLSNILSAGFLLVTEYYFHLSKRSEYLLYNVMPEDSAFGVTERQTHLKTVNSDLITSAGRGCCVVVCGGFHQWPMFLAVFGAALHTVCATRLFQAAEVIGVLTSLHRSPNTTVVVVVVRHSGFVARAADRRPVEFPRQWEGTYRVYSLYPANGGLRGPMRAAGPFVYLSVITCADLLLSGHADVLWSENPLVGISPPLFGIHVSPVFKSAICSCAIVWVSEYCCFCPNEIFRLLCIIKSLVALLYLCQDKMVNGLHL